jgi:hypothetical protein
MGKASLFLSAVVALGCGGKAKEHGVSAQGGAEGSAGGASGAAGPSFVPDNPSVTAAGDGRLEGGGFDKPQGEGWDTCYTTTPGLVHAGDAPEESFFKFDSTRSCEQSFCSMSGGPLQLAFFFEPALAAGEQQQLYFDVVNLGDDSPRGELHIGVLGTEPICSVKEELATIPLAQLDMVADWQTRCVTFTAGAAFPAFGIYVSGESFQVGLDTFRFGPACHAR